MGRRLPQEYAFAKGIGTVCDGVEIPDEKVGKKLGDHPDEIEPAALQHADPWLEAAAWVSLGLGIPKSVDRPGLGSRLRLISRSVYATAKSYERFVESGDAPTEVREFAEQDLIAMYERDLQAHALLVSAHMFWDLLGDLRSHLTIPRLEKEWAASEEMRRNAIDARHHYEHAAERIKQGRSTKWQEPLDRDEFRAAFGHFEGTTIRFGSETFDLKAIHDSVIDLSARVAPIIREGVALRISMKQQPPTS